MLVVLSTFVVMGAMQDVARAERLYDQARYEDALMALGASCDEAPNVADCERVRGYVCAALGRDDEARQAFARMLDFDDNATLPPDVSPRLRNLFDAARAEKGELTKLTLAGIDVLSVRGPWIVRAQPPPTGDVRAIVVYIAPAGSDAFQPVTLAPEGEAWVGTFRPASGGTGTVRYFIESRVGSGATVTSGSSAVPRQIPAIVGGGDEGTELIEPDAPEDEGAPGFLARLSQKTGLPEWALWSIGGGAVAAVAGGATLTYFMLRDPDPGNIRVKVQYEH